MEKRFCPKCQNEIKPIYGKAYKEKGEWRTFDGAIARPKEWLCSICKEIYTIEVVGIVD